MGTAGVSEFFYYDSKYNVFFGGVGWGRGRGRAVRGGGYCK